ncbi:hypothetical protein ACOME3_001689 [Neoechinorhynchus agilis]
MPIPIEDILLEKNALRLASIPLGTRELISLVTAVHAVKLKMNLKRVEYWGKIRGIDKDYHIIIEIDNCEINDREYFFSTDFENWNPIKFIDQDIDELCLLCKERFTGDPDNDVVLVNVKAKTDDFSGLTLQTFEKYFHIEMLTIKEKERLGIVVMNIEKDTSLVPRGSFVRDPDDRVFRNKYFLGLRDDQSKYLRSYLHLNKAALVNVCEDLVSVPSIDFLRTLENDEFSETWKIKKFPFTRLVVVRSVRWIGYMFYSFNDQNRFGSLYIGDGIRSSDFVFSA